MDRWTGRAVLGCLLACLAQGGCRVTDPNAQSTMVFSGAARSAEAAPGAGCASDADCKGGRACQAGACVTRADPATVRAVETGSVATAHLSALSQGRQCVSAPGLAAAVDEAASFTSGAELETLIDKLGADSTRPPGESLGDWLLAVHDYSRTCNVAVNAERLGQSASRLSAAVSEKTVEDAAKRSDCRQLTGINTLGLWPFEQRFSQEVVARKFSDAEITRKVWLETMKTFGDDCQKRLSQREKIGVATVIERLEGVIGLDDTMLIGLRTKLLAAMEKGDASAIAALSQAVSEREASLGSRRAASDLKAEMKKLELRQRIAEKKMAQQATAAAAAPAAPAAAGAPPGAGGPTAADAVNAVNTGREAVNIARSLFGF